MEFSGQEVRICVGGRVLSPMRQNGGDEAGSGLLLRADGGRKAGSLSAGREDEHMVEEVLGTVVRPARYLLQSPCR